MRTEFKVPMVLARVSKTLTQNLGLAAARVSDLNETLDGSLGIAIENGPPWPYAAVDSRFRTRVSLR